MLDHTINKQCCFSNIHKTMNNSVSDCFSLTNFKSQCWLVNKKLFLPFIFALNMLRWSFFGSRLYGKIAKLLHIYKKINYKYLINLLLLLNSETNADQSDRLLSMSEFWP